LEYLHSRVTGSPCPSWKNYVDFPQLLEGLRYLQSELFLPWQSHDYFSQLLEGLVYLHSKVSLFSLGRAMTTVLLTVPKVAGVSLLSVEPFSSWQSRDYVSQLLR
jgi:hypothetical protein